MSISLRLMKDSGKDFMKYAEDLCTVKTIPEFDLTCQWHFVRNMNEHKFEIDERFRQRLHEIC